MTLGFGPPYFYANLESALLFRWWNGIMSLVEWLEVERH
jgi:hypothetical protein